MRAEGYALALQKISEIAKSLDQNTMGLQYLETLKNLGASASSKFIFPMEFASFLKPILPVIQQQSGAGPSAGQR